MKKRLLALALGLCMVLTMAGCQDEKEEVNKRVPVLETELIKIYQYKGLDVQMEASLEVSEEDIDASIASTLSVYASENTEDVAEDGDYVVIDYVGKVDGEVFEGGSAEDQAVTIGSGKYIPGFEEGIIGHKVGDTFDVPVTFPKEYAEELAGKAAVFTMTLKGISPELTDEWVQKISVTCDTVEEYREEHRLALVASNSETWVYELEGKIWDTLVNQCSVSEYPQDMVQEQYAVLEAMFSNLLDVYSLDELVQSYFGISADTYAANVIKQTLAADAIAEAEGIEVTEEEYQECLKEYAAQYGYEDIAEFEATVGKEALERNFINREVGMFLIENCVQYEEYAKYFN